MIILGSCKCGQNRRKRHSRCVLLSGQKSLEKTISAHSKNLFRNFYCTTDIRKKIKHFADSKFNLSLHLQLLQPNTHCYEQLLQTVCSTIHESALAKPTMLDFCLQLHTNNNTLGDIRNFAEKYRAEHSIYWYTKESFVYRCISQTLRSGDIDKCYSIRFYIADLSAQLHALKCQQQKVMEKAGMTILYRDIRQSNEELNAFRSLVGCVVGTKSFMSTSRNKNIALTYASPSDWQAEDSRPLLLEIYVDLSAPAIIAADITDMSNFDEECEVLFNIGSTFRVEMLTFDILNNIWLCKFIATNGNLAHIQEFQTIPLNAPLSQLILHRSDIICSNRTIRYEQGDITDRSLRSLTNNRYKLPWLAYELIDWAYIRHIDCIIKLQQTDIDQLPKEFEHVLEIYAQVDVHNVYDGLQIASCMNNYGYVNLFWGKQIQFINLLKNSLKIREKYLPHDHILLDQSYRNVGLAYANVYDYYTAFGLHGHALNINQHASIAAQWSMVTTLRNMGDLCSISDHCTRAMEYYSKAIDTYYKCLNFFNSTS